MSSLYGELNESSIGVINIPHETYRLRQNEFDWLSGKLNENGKIVSLMDNDFAGKHEAIWLRNNYNIVPLLIPKEYNSKDFAELIYNNDIKDVTNLIIKSIKYIKEYERKSNKDIRNVSKRNDTLPF